VDQNVPIPPAHNGGPSPTAALNVLGKRTVLIGTRESISALAAQLKGTIVRATGCIIVESPSGTPAATPEKFNSRSPSKPTATTSIAGLTVLGGFHQLPEAHRVLSFTLAIVSLPSALAAWQLRVRARLRELSLPERIVPPIEDLLALPPVAAVRTNSSDLDVTELIGRTPYGLDRHSVSKALTNKRVLITGAGGSIGSELARIVATFHPEQLVLMERAENSLFEIDRQIARRFPEIKRKAVLHDVVDADATLRHCVQLKPHVVFHAAAHKHVPLMEDHPSHAVTNNLFGTKSIADAAVATGAERFVLISSDKAVNPTSVMGATKRLAEIYTQSLNRRGSSTRCCMVRFGNVLGSACSVLPIWGGQLAEGGPITVTDPRMTRYFMTIHEAATLVIQASAAGEASAVVLGKEPAVFVLDMGDPVRVVDLAQRFIRAHGFAPRVVDRTATPLPEFALPEPADDTPTIDIVLTGARPGEKLHEELAYAAESLHETHHPGIRAWASDVAKGVDVTAMVSDLAQMRQATDHKAVLAAIRRYVPDGTFGESSIAPAAIEPKDMVASKPTLRA
jgi:FlaA1/EpsC-like NDP-sugar epimerase